MFRKSFFARTFISLFLFLLGYVSLPMAQITFSPFSDATVAKVAGTGVGFDLNANPALTGQFLPGQRFQFTCHDVLDDEEVNFFDRRLPDFLLKFALTSRISCAMQKSDFNPYILTTASRVDWYKLQPFHWLLFSYNPDWSVGLAAQLNDHYVVGWTLRHEVYQNQAFYRAYREFRTYDLGVLRTGNRLQMGLVLRNIIKEDLTGALPAVFYDYNGQPFTGDPFDFPGIFNRPAFFAELGLQYQPHPRFQTRSDVSTRAEIALGFEWRMVYKFHFTTGYGYKYNWIYKDKPLSSGALGLQFRTKPISLAFTWVFGLGADAHTVMNTRWGQYEFHQAHKNRAYLGVALTF